MPTIRVITSASGNLSTPSGQQNLPTVVKILQASGVGAQGPPGPRGATGTSGGGTGDTGPTGPAGTGDTGPQGPSGETGADGPSGDTGPQGPIGNTGASIVELFYGPTSPSTPEEGNLWFNSDSGLFFVYVNDGDSSQWVQIVGSLGQTGSTGNDGPTGSIGETGPAGTGDTGPQGLKGDTGEQGPIGNTGAGVTGADGETGPIGDTGEAGTNGETGPIGDTGPIGNTGEKGDTGEQGPIGNTGQDGSGGGGSTLNAGEGLVLSANVAGVGYTMSINSGAVIHVAGISSDGGVTFPDGTYQDTASTGIAGDTGPIGDTGPKGDTGEAGTNGTNGGGATLAAGDGVTLSTIVAGVGYTLGIDPTAIIHVAGVSSDGGITFPNGTFQTVAWDPSSAIDLTGGDTSTPSMTITSDDNGTDAAPIIDLIRDPVDNGNGTNGDYLGQIKFKGQSDSGTERIYAKITGKIGSATNSDEDGVVEHMVRRDGGTQIVFRTTKTGIKLNDDGGTPMELEFSDGTSISTAPTGSSVTASYSGHLESAIVKTYYLDPRLPVERTVTEFYAICATGGCSAGIAGLNGSISTISISSTGVTGSLANTTLPLGGTLDMTLSNVSNCFDLRFAVRYTQ